jgi:hypothetical protein
VPFFPTSQIQPLGDLRDPSSRVAHPNLLPSPRKALLRAYRAAWKQLKSIAQLRLAAQGETAKYTRVRGFPIRVDKAQTKTSTFRNASVTIRG